MFYKLFNLELSDLESQGLKILYNDESIESAWKELNSINPNSRKAFKLYAIFHSDILRDGASSIEYLKR